jgi:hypothetical protein
MRQKLRGPTGQAVYRRRKALVEPVWGTLKEQRGMRRFRLRGLEKVSIEFTLAAISFNLTRLLAASQPGPATITTSWLMDRVLTRSLKARRFSGSLRGAEAPLFHNSLKRVSWRGLGTHSQFLQICAQLIQ